MARFSQIQRSAHLPDMIVREIMHQISTSQLHPGETLPKETTLAENFGVSRNVVREAISRLRADGVVETKQGRGAIVLPLSERSTFRVNLDELHEEKHVAQLFELRGLLEIDAAGLATRRCKPHHIKAIEDAFADMSGSRDFDSARREADAAFHRAIGDATGNEYLAEIVNYLSSRLKETIAATSAVYDGNDLVNVTINEHRAILDAIRGQNPLAARQAMQQHINGASSRLGVPQPQGARMGGTAP